MSEVKRCSENLKPTNKTKGKYNECKRNKSKRNYQGGGI